MTLPARITEALAARRPERVTPGLERMVALMDLLGSPQDAYPSVHVTGTNGKTSTVRLVDSVLRAAGLRTGAFTSPALSGVTEQITLAGQPISPERFTEVYDEIAPYAVLVDAEHRVSYFEFLTALAFAAFADAPVDAAVVEVGIGGTWDATNVVRGAVSVVTPVDLDHTDVLGGTVEAIAEQKAGVIKPSSTVVTARQDAAVLAVLRESARAQGARLLVEDVDFELLDRRVAVGGQMLDLRVGDTRYREVFLPLHGRHQAHNAAVAVTAATALIGPLSEEVLAEGLGEADSPGRLELRPGPPAVLLDAAHNPAGARALAEAVGEAFAFPYLVAVLAVLADKDAAGILAALAPVLDAVVVTQNGSPRALAAHQLGSLAGSVLPGRTMVADDLPAALERATELALRHGGAILVTGSVVTVGAVRDLLDAARDQAPGGYR